MLFDDDDKRDRVWTHFSAYEQLPGHYDLVAVCDPDASRRERAVSRRESVRVFATVDEMLDAEELDVLSICTPVELHAQQLHDAAGRVRAVVCEKPLSGDAATGEAALRACESAGTLVVVNYYKRFETAVRAAKRLLEAGELGSVAVATVLYSGGVDAVGSHAVDLLSYLVGPVEPAGTIGPGSAAFALPSGGAAAVLVAGAGSDLVFEVDIIGSEGRARLLDNCSSLEVARFHESARYGGYRELAAAHSPHLAPADPFLALFLDLATVMNGADRELSSRTAEALATQRLVDVMRSHAE
jgi:predicted dehydrogenase